ncbi:hypothetical protein LXL04_034115 [Taraxacum kok-saghyz]
MNHRGNSVNIQFSHKLKLISYSENVISGSESSEMNKNGNISNLGPMIPLKPLAGSLNQESIEGGHMYSGFGLKTTLALAVVILKRDYVTTVFDNFSANVVVSCATEDYNRLRPLSYRGADVFILAFSLISKASYENVSKKSIPELKHYAPGVPIVLVGTKIDLWDDKQFFADHPNAVPITTAQGEELTKTIGAPAFIECSAKTQENVKTVFDSAIKVVLAPPSSKKKKGNAQKGCSIL